MDDHPVFIDGKSAILRDLISACKIYTAHSEQEATNQMEQLGAVDWVFFDLHLPAIGGVDLLDKIDDRMLLTSIVVVTSEKILR